MTLDLAMYQLRTFREVARLGSFTKAARSLGYAQSSVTAHIRLLESKVGMLLVQRLPHGVRLTPSGEIFHEYSKRIFNVVDEMATALNPPGELEGRTAVGASALLLETRVGSLIRDCRYRYPKVSVSPRQLSIGGATSAVLGGELDMALVHGDFTGAEVAPAGITMEELPDLEVVPVGAASLADPAHWAAALPMLKVLAVDPDCASHQVLVTALREVHGIDPPVIEAGSMGGARELARMGYGIAMLPAESVKPDGEGSGLAGLPGLPRVRLGVRAFWLGREMSAAAVSAVRDVAVRSGQEKVRQLT
ncbi:LysR family transcriptional regulator [Streptomyces sp. NBC_01218]|uniref:LysR family transcriptional regulator n=1 Tax=unclassified Streptomyces TaxID=2593676 RepID=UPI0023B9980A|nr:MULTISPECIES: LysR family transcriptional regulator [unclassified Streptomyces]WEH39230.1 LysR family transcriptional regulator [Streptomyces sp. AM 2-1-1]WSQ50880.1 LysR family transcriptional regulator [Streptomyces sp. NBC_01218]